jgi:hypothetical protein
VVYGGLPVLALILAALVISKMVSQTFIPAEPLDHAFYSFDRQVALFDGMAVSPPQWLAVEGAWAPARDLEGGSILAGRGIIRRQLLNIRNYRLTLGIDLHDAKTGELHFGLGPATDVSQARYVLRVTRLGITLGKKTADLGEYKALSESIPYPPEEPVNNVSYHELRVERRETVWWVFFDNKSLGKFPVMDQPEEKEFRLVVDGGRAYFDSLSVQGFVPKRQK